MKGYYINLENRTDRNEKIKNLIQNNPIFSDTHRYNAHKYSRQLNTIPKPLRHKCTQLFGAVGCGISHYNALTKLYELYPDDNYYIILEDDFKILNQDIFDSFVEDFDKIKELDWDVILFCPNNGIPMKTTQKFSKYNFVRVKNTWTATGYIVKREFVTNLLFSFGQSIIQMKNGRNNPIDVNWHNLQECGGFYYYDRGEPFIVQEDGYSNIRYEHRKLTEWYKSIYPKK